ncbi:unnamed protein product [Onchocerca flexuosa]|uniref:Gag_p10 domain-containing protein n=1 Tax=Onchocerca flexuosa TaxID=387005 RepID=A0A183HND9_9BILA|nr:unnamed protein product [Onchocerca flexuosa]
MANFIGFYNNPAQNKRVGIDFPNITEWPQGFVPVPIHTVGKNTDYVGIPDAHCPRQNWLMKLVQQTPEWKNLVKKYTGVLEELATICKQSLSLKEVPRCVDAFYCEKLHAFKIPVSDNQFDQLQQLSYEIQNYENGLSK